MRNEREPKAMINRHKMCCVAWKNNMKIEEEAEERGRCVECEIMYAKSNIVVISFHQSCWDPSKVPGGGWRLFGTIFELEGGAADLQT